MRTLYLIRQVIETHFSTPNDTPLDGIQSQEGLGNFDNPIVRHLVHASMQTPLPRPQFPSLGLAAHVFIHLLQSLRHYYPSPKGSLSGLQRTDQLIRQIEQKIITYKSWLYQ